MRTLTTAALTAALILTPTAALATDRDVKVCYGEPVLVTPAIDAVEAVAPVVEIVEHPATFKDVMTDPGQPATETTYKEVLVKEATPAQPEQSFIRYTYQKETKTTREHKHGKVEHVSDWSWWAPASYKTSDGARPAVLETGLHATWTDGPWTYTRAYRYVPNGAEKKVITREAAPGTDAVYETVVDVPGLPYVAPTFETVIDGDAWVETVTVTEGRDAVAAIPAVYDTPIIDCPKEEEPSVPTEPVIVVPSPGPVNPAPKPSDEPTPVPSQPSTPPTPSSPGSDPTPSPSPQTSSAVETPNSSPTTPRPELAETGLNGGHASLAIALIAAGVGAVMVSRSLIRRRP